MATAPETLLMLDAFLRLPEERPALEYVDGNAAQKPMPKARRGRLQKRLCQEFDEALAPGLAAFPELRCTFAGRSLVPDVVILRREQLPCDERGQLGDDVRVAPHATVEILSPEQNVAAVVEKIGFCLSHGVRWSCLIDPDRERVVVFRPDDLPMQLSASDVLADEQLPGFQLAVRELFAWLQQGN
jgi:Uma2 family endonuclease